MNFEFSDEQNMLKDTLTRFLREQYDFDTRNKIIASKEGWSPDIWQQMAEMGLMGAAFPEEYDGYGGSQADMLVMMEAFGKALLVEPFIPTVILAGQCLREIGGDHARELIPQIIDGSLVMGLAHAEPRSHFNLAHVETQAETKDDHYVLNGHKAVVLAAPIAGKLILSARTGGDPLDEGGISLFLVDTDQDGITIQAYPTIDGFQAGDVILENVKVAKDQRLDDKGAAYPIIEKTYDRAIIASAGEAIGICKTMCLLTAEYCQNREQFGQPISRFQVLQHRMVDMFIHKEEMISMAYMGAVKLETDNYDDRVAASATKVQLGKSCKFIGESAIQLHGGMGITEEMSIGHYFMRGTMLETLFGNSDYHLRRYQSLTS